MFRGRVWVRVSVRVNFFLDFRVYGLGFKV